LLLFVMTLSADISTSVRASVSITQFVVIDSLSSHKVTGIVEMINPLGHKFGIFPPIRLIATQSNRWGLKLNHVSELMPQEAE